MSQLGVANVGVGDENWVMIRRHVSSAKNFAVVLQGYESIRLALTGFVNACAGHFGVGVI